LPAKGAEEEASRAGYLGVNLEAGTHAWLKHMSNALLWQGPRAVGVMAHQRRVLAAFVVSVTLLSAVEGLAISKPNKLSRISCDVAAHPALCEVVGRKESFSSLQQAEELALQEGELPLSPKPLRSRRPCRLRGVKSDGTAEGILSDRSECRGLTPRMQRDSVRW
jgi:hypothetical protein